MSNYIYLGLTLIPIWFIIIIVKKRRKVFRDRIRYRQSNIHNLIRNSLLLNNTTKSKAKISQARNHTAKNMIRVVVTDGKAYWVSNNVFYVSDIRNGDPDLETAKKVDAIGMSKQELEKMLSILDSLGNGINDDSGGTRNT
jgi:hypothetical protein